MALDEYQETVFPLQEIVTVPVAVVPLLRLALVTPFIRNICRLR